jgi:hypothetical protein
MATIRAIYRRVKLSWNADRPANISKRIIPKAKPSLAQLKAPS